MIGRLKDLNSSIKRRVIFNRDEIVDSSNEGITSQRENIVEEPVNNDIDIRSTSQDYDREEDRQSVRRKLREIQNQSKRISFGQAFKNARAAGKKTFWWRGNEYNTKTKAESDAEKKSANNKTTSNKSSNNRTSSNRTNSNRITNTSNSASNKQNNTITSATNKKVVTNNKAVTNTKSASTNNRNTGITKKRTSNFENYLNRYGSINKFEFKQNYQTSKKETPKRKVRLSDEELMRELKRRNEKRIRSQKNNPIYRSKGTKLENMLGM